MECDYAKYGCAAKLYHLQGLAYQHLKNIVIYMEMEQERTRKQLERLEGVLHNKVNDLDSKFQMIQDMPAPKDNAALSEHKRIHNTDQRSHQGDSIKVEIALASGSEVQLHRDNTRDVQKAEDNMKNEDKSNDEHTRHEQEAQQSAAQANAEVERLKKDMAQKAKERLREEKHKKLQLEKEQRAMEAQHTKPNKEMVTMHPRVATPLPHIEQHSEEQHHAHASVHAKLQSFPDALLGTALIWEYNAESHEWCRGAVNFRLTKNFFAEGGLRTAHMMEIHGDVTAADEFPVDVHLEEGKKLKSDILPTLGSSNDKFVAKLSKRLVPVHRYFEDVKMQTVCVELAKKFNQQGLPKKVEFLTAWVLEIPKENGALWGGLERFIQGEFKKQNNNTGSVLASRNTPQAFSHFTWESTNHGLIVVDLQGVDDYYTDPQVHSSDGAGFGVGNLGRNGIDSFLKSHQCNAVCQLLKLPRINAIDTKSAQQKMIKGTQQLPVIDDQLGNLSFPHMHVGEDGEGEFQCILTLNGHVDRVVSLCVTANHLFSGSSDGSIRVWTFPGLTLDREIQAHRKTIETMCANEKYFFTGSADNSIKVWDVATLASIIALRDHSGEVNALVLTHSSLNYLVSASSDKSIKVWSLRTLKCVQTLLGHTKNVKSLAISGSILLSGSNDGSIFMWSLKNLSCLFTIDAHDGWVKSLVVKEKKIYSGSFDSLIKEWDMTSFQKADILRHEENVNSLCLTDNFLISASDDKSATVWDLATHKKMAVLKGHRSSVQAVATDGKYIFTGSDDCSIKVWKWATHK